MHLLVEVQDRYVEYNSTSSSSSSSSSFVCVCVCVSMSNYGTSMFSTVVPILFLLTVVG